MGKKPVLIAVVLVLFTAVAFLGYNYLKPATKEPPPKKKMLVKMGEFVTNLAGDGRRFIKVQLDVEMDSEESGKELLAKTSQMRDQVILVLRSKTPGDLSGPDGLKHLSQDILDKANNILTQGKALAIYFTDFAIQ